MTTIPLPFCIIVKQPDLPCFNPNTMSTPQPLWRVMQDAHRRVAGAYLVFDEEILGEPDHETRAAEIRAIADWLVPEEEPITDQEAECLVTCGKRRQRTRHRDRLLAEADRAEAGE